MPVCALVYLGERKEKRKSHSVAMRCDALGWLRRFARFHGIKDSVLNPRDCIWKHGYSGSGGEGEEAGKRK